MFWNSWSRKICKEMSIMVKIDGVPLFNSKWRAEQWGKKFGLTGTHTHVHINQVGWMAGETHDELKKVFKPRERVFQATQTQGLPQQLPTYNQQQPTQQAAPYTPPAPSTPSSGGSGGGGGY